MFHSLKLRLLFPIAVILFSALLLITFSSREAAKSEFDHFLSVIEMDDEFDNIENKLTEIARMLLKVHQADEGWGKVNLQKILVNYPNSDFYLFDNGHNLISSSKHIEGNISLLNKHILSVSIPSNDKNRDAVSFALKTTNVVIKDNNGLEIATLHTIPKNILKSDKPKIAFIRGLDNQFILIFSLICLVSILLTILSTYRVLKPVSELTKAEVEVLKIHEETRRELEKKISTFTQEDYLIIGGDFNARTAPITDYEITPRKAMTIGTC